MDAEGFAGLAFGFTGESFLKFECVSVVRFVVEVVIGMIGNL